MGSLYGFCVADEICLSSFLIYKRFTNGLKFQRINQLTFAVRFTVYQDKSP